MSSKQHSIGWLNVSGSAFEIGEAMGKKGHDSVHKDLLSSAIWASIQAHNETPKIDRMMENTQHRFPLIWAELQGLAKGLDLSLREVFAWNSRGDILASVPDGCTSILRPSPDLSIAHNEDGLPFFRGQCFILNASPTSGINFNAFCYPGSIAGHTFGWNQAGLVQTVNNLRLKEVSATIPRMVLSRAVLSCATLDEAVNILSDAPECGGFHIALAQSTQQRLISVEYGAGTVSVKHIDTLSGHANHAIHLAEPNQMITQSSADRQMQIACLTPNLKLSSLDILRDATGPGLPIRRDDPNDPDDENTLATCVFKISDNGVDWRIYSTMDDKPEHQGHQALM